MFMEISKCREKCSSKIFKTTNALRLINNSNNNNNSLMKINEMAMGDKESAAAVVANKVVGEQKPTWNCSFDAIIGVGNAAAAVFVEDEGGGLPARTCNKGKENGQQFQQAKAAGSTLESECDVFAAGAAYDDIEEAAAAVNFHSNRTSRNNSMDNLSFSSDNYYSEDLIFLEECKRCSEESTLSQGLREELENVLYYDDDDGGAEVEDISLNSDDCVYAYRGDGAEFDFPLEPSAGRHAGIASNSMDDEMDFLEMDFEPDTLSEIENGGNSFESDAATAAATDAFLMQRDERHLNGKHSSSTQILPAAVQQQRQLFSSPIEDLPLKALQSQTLLGKNFGRMSLHLDQIKGGTECLTSDVVGCETIFERTRTALGGASTSNGDQPSHNDMSYAGTTAHSLPNTLHSFGREHILHEQKATPHKTSPSKVTGAKPKRLSTFSTSSSTSSKNSSKSRSSLRSVIVPPLFNSCSFDERSVSCTEFRSAPPPPVADDATALAISANVLANPFELNDESCLDCLEKEFLASTIGKVLEPNNCSKCRRKQFGYFRSEQHSRCRSGSPTFFDGARDYLYELPHEFLDTSRKDWLNESRMASMGLNTHCTDIGTLSLLTRRQDVPLLPAATENGFRYNAGAIKCDNLNGEQLLKSLLTDKEIATISTIHVSESTVARALEQLHISYNAELLKLYFERHHATTTNLTNNKSNDTANCQEFKDLKEFLLHESKKNCNHIKLRRLIELITHQQVEIQFKKDTNIIKSECVDVSVADIYTIWTRNHNLMNLQELDKRFTAVNVLGKIANLIRQTQTKTQRTPTLRAQPESIAIPQYYPSGFLIIKKKCSQR